MVASRIILIIAFIASMQISSVKAQTLRKMAMTESESTELYTCPEEVPEVDSHCESDASPSSNLCFYNPIHVENVEEDVPSMACICSHDGMWSCSINPEYVLTIQQVSV